MEIIFIKNVIINYIVSIKMTILGLPILSRTVNYEKKQPGWHEAYDLNGKKITSNKINAKKYRFCLTQNF